MSRKKLTSVGKSFPNNVAWGYKGGSVPPEYKVNYNYEDIPSSVAKKLSSKKLGMGKRDPAIEQHFGHLWTILNFMDRHAMKSVPKKPSIKGQPGVVRPPSRTYTLAQEDAVNEARVLLETPLPKSFKKTYKTGDMAGSGGFGDVIVAKEIKTKTRFALKKIKHEGERDILQNLTEIAFLVGCKHANICQFVNAFKIREKPKGNAKTKDSKHEEVDICVIVLEYMEGGTLSEAAASGSLTEDHIAFVAGESLKGLNYLHQKQWVHRDMKSANVMMSITGQIKLIDFGLCADFSNGPRKRILGSPFWIPPEMIWGHPHSYPVDVWSLGVCILELFAASPPYPESPMKCMFKTATEGLMPCCPKDISSEGRKFLTKCLTMDYRKRATIKQLLKDPWVDRTGLNAGIKDVLKQVFVANSFQHIGFG
eukprot:TRINITY_DN10654_c0_g1_i1.p1 TRINITY_DN10654_c0_g1~~TRINITY_DN10654_c0_g1_i1.p1  ORF type:complete len:423 (-),score=81.95 TRINITY_DN10654_c0_g1_i1:245-1513(-)